MHRGEACADSERGRWPPTSHRERPGGGTLILDFSLQDGEIVAPAVEAVQPWSCVMAAGVAG